MDLKIKAALRRERLKVKIDPRSAPPGVVQAPLAHPSAQEQALHSEAIQRRANELLEASQILTRKAEAATKARQEEQAAKEAMETRTGRTRRHRRLKRVIRNLRV